MAGVNGGLAFRFLLDFISVSLLVAGLAYWWLDNWVHELIGTGMFLLIILHNLFNRRWHGAIRKGRYDARRRINMAVILGLALAMLVLLVTSLLLSRDLLAFLGPPGGVTAREAHMLAAYWAIVIVSIHLGTRWQTVIEALGLRYGGAIEGRVLTWFARLIALAIAAYGVESLQVMGFGSKLILSPTLDMWDFHASTPEFFARYGAIIGLFVFLAHQGVKLVRWHKRRAAMV